MAFFFSWWLSLGHFVAGKLLFYKKRTEYVVRGGCERTGQCCRNLAIEIPASWAKRSKIVALFNLWYRTVFNFHSVGVIYGNWLVYECHYLKSNADKTKYSCGIYPYRPKLCREFPIVPWFGHGRLHKGCGFWFLKRSEVGQFGEALAKQSHDLEREQYLKNTA